mgnify:CR=1 FL=1
MGVPQVMQSDTRNVCTPHQRPKRITKSMRVNDAAIQPGEDQVLILVDFPEFKPLLVLFNSVILQRADKARGNRDNARPTTLRVFKYQSTSGSLERTADSRGGPG